MTTYSVHSATGRVMPGAGKLIDPPAPIAALQVAVVHHLDRGYRLVGQTETAAALVKPKRFSVAVCAFLLLLGILPGLIYVVRYRRAYERMLYLSVDEAGNVQHREEWAEHGYRAPRPSI